MEQEPGQVAVKGFGIPPGGEVAVFKPPVGNGAADAVDDLPHAFFPLRGVRFAEEILAGNDIDGELAPCFGEFAVILLEKNGAAVSFDDGGSVGPFDGIEGIAGIFGTERRCHSESFGGNVLERIGVGINGVNSIQTDNRIHN